jgi:hypothetical protein
MKLKPAKEATLWVVKCPDCSLAEHVIQQGKWWLCLDCDTYWPVEVSK